MRSTCSGIGVITARIDSPVRLIDVGAHARETLDDDVDPGRVARHLPDDADRADRAAGRRARVVDLALLQDEQQHAIAAERAVDRFDRHRAIDGERLHAQRKGDRAAQRQDREFGWQRWNGAWLWIRAWRPYGYFIGSARGRQRECRELPGPSRVSCG